MYLLPQCLISATTHTHTYVNTYTKTLTLFVNLLLYKLILFSKRCCVINLLWMPQPSVKQDIVVKYELTFKKSIETKTWSWTLINITSYSTLRIAILVHSWSDHGVFTVINPFQAEITNTTTSRQPVPQRAVCCNNYLLFPIWHNLYVPPLLSSSPLPPLLSSAPLSSS